MATYRVLYWKDIPSQVKAEDASDEVSLPFGQEIENLIDRRAGELGLTGTDDYLDQWHWGEDQERPGTAAEVAEAVRRELLAETNMD